MSVGTGIFLGAFCLAVVLLYTGTKDRWRWRRIGAWLAGGVVALALIAAAAFEYSEYRDKQPKTYTKQTALLDVAIGTKPEDVLFRRGEPSSRSEKQWTYDKEQLDEVGDNTELVVRFKDGVVEFVALQSTFPSAGPGLLDIDIGDSYDTLLRQLGEPSNVSISADGLRRMLTYSPLGSFFVLQEGKVITYGVVSDSRGQMRFTQEWKGASAPE